MRGSVAGQLRGALRGMGRDAPRCRRGALSGLPRPGRARSSAARCCVDGVPVARTAAAADPVTPVVDSRLDRLVPGAAADHPVRPGSHRDPGHGGRAAASRSSTPPPTPTSTRSQPVVDRLGPAWVAAGSAGLAAAMARRWSARTGARSERGDVAVDPDPRRRQLAAPGRAERGASGCATRRRPLAPRYGRRERDHHAGGARRRSRGRRRLRRAGGRAARADAPTTPSSWSVATGPLRPSTASAPPRSPCTPHWPPASRSARSSAAPPTASASSPPPVASGTPTPSSTSSTGCSPAPTLGRNPHDLGTHRPSGAGRDPRRRRRASARRSPPRPSCSTRTCARSASRSSSATPTRCGPVPSGPGSTPTPSR